MSSGFQSASRARRSMLTFGRLQSLDGRRLQASAKSSCRSRSALVFETTTFFQSVDLPMHGSGEMTLVRCLATAIVPSRHSEKLPTMSNSGQMRFHRRGINQASWRSRGAKPLLPRDSPRRARIERSRPAQIRRDTNSFGLSDARGSRLNKLRENQSRIHKAIGLRGGTKQLKGLTHEVV
jgi:hypothetical protein